MVSEYVKVRNINSEWIKDKVIQSLHPSKYHIRLTLITTNKLEFEIKPKWYWSDAKKLIITSNERRAGMIKITLNNLDGSGYIGKFGLKIWDKVAENLRFSLAGQTAKQKCWNCFEDKDYRDNFCRNCGKT